MCAHELITLGQNCDFRMEPIAPASNGSNNQTLRNCKVVNIPNSVNTKLLIPNLSSQTRIPNLDGNYSDESSDTEQENEAAQTLVSRTARLYRNKLLDNRTDVKQKQSPTSTHKSRNQRLIEKCRSKSTVEGFSLSRPKSKLKRKKRLKFKKVKKKKSEQKNSKESNSYLNIITAKSENIGLSVESDTKMTEIKDIENTNSLVSEGIACITTNQSNLNVSSHQNFVSLNNSLSYSNSVVTVTGGLPSSMAANVVSLATPQTMVTSNMAMRPGGSQGQLVAVTGIPNQQVLYMSGGQAFPAQVNTSGANAGQSSNIILSASPMPMAMMQGGVGVTATGGMKTTLISTNPTMSQVPYTSHSVGVPVCVSAGNLGQPSSAGYITIPQQSIGINHPLFPAGSVAVSSGGTVVTNVISSVPVVAGTSTSPLHVSMSGVGDLGPPKLSPEIVTLPPPVQSKDQKIEPIKNKDGTLVWVCNVCNKMMPSENELANHKKRHKIPEALICPYCNRSYIDKHRYAVHVRIHTGEMPYTCHVCNKKFRDDRKLKLHMARHTSGLSHKCHLCPRSFEGPKALEKHLQAHSLGRHVAPKIITNTDGSVTMGLPIDKNSQLDISGQSDMIEQPSMAPRCTIPSPILDNADLDKIVEKLSFDMKSTTDESKDDDSVSASSSMISLSMDDVYQYNMPQPAVTDAIR